MRIRKATIKDIKILVDFWYEEEKLHKKFDAHAKLRSNAKNRIYNFLKINIKKPNYAAFIAEDKNEIIGVLQGQIKKWYFLHDMGEYGYYSTIFIKRVYRKRGVAKMLFKRMASWFKSKKIRVVALLVHSKNKVALKAWKNLGFRERLKWMDREI